MSQLEIVFVRHAESVGNPRTPEDRAADNKPSHAFDLTEAGIEQIKRTSEYLKKRCEIMDKKWAFPVQNIFQCSNMTRAIRTAELLHSGPWERDSRLNEADRGIYGSVETAERQRCFPGEDARQQKLGFYWHRAPGGQNWPDVEMQVTSWIESQHRRFSLRLSQAGDFYRLYVVGHGNWFQVLQMLASGRPYTEYVSDSRTLLPVVDNASVTILSLDARAQFGIKILEGPIVPWKEPSIA